MTRAFVAGAVALFVLAACGGGGAPAATAAVTAAAPAGTSDVAVQGFRFAPEALEVAAGTKVTWTNKDGATHTTTSGAPGAKDGRWEGQLAGSGGTFSFTFAQAGTYAYFCAIHGASMTGKVVVK